MLPSKKILVLAAIAISVCVIGYISYKKNSVLSYNANADGLTVANGKAIPANNNALLPNFPQSDAWRNSLASSSTKTTLQPLGPTTVTDQFAQDFFNQYMSAKRSGTTFDSTNADEFAASYLNSSELPTIIGTQYSESRLNLVDTHQTTLKNYKVQITAIMQQHWPVGQTTELTVLQNAFVNNDKKALQGLIPIIGAYQTVLDKSLAIPVPKLAASVHLAMLNSLSTYIKTLQGITTAYTDPIVGLAALNGFEANAGNLTASLINIQSYLQTNVQ